MDSKDKEMSFWDHLEVLRGTIVRSALSILLLSVAVFCFREFVFGKIVFGPIAPGFFLYEWMGSPVDVDLINVNVTAQFMVHMKESVILGFILSFPYICFEIWRFIAPALYEQEKKPVRVAFIGGSVLFYVGLLVGYLIILPLALHFFLTYQVSDLVQNSITLDSYISLFNSTILAFGIVFEFPMVVVLLSHLGVLHRAALNKYRKHALVAVLVVAAIITPADPLSMLIAAVPLWLLFELSVLLCKK